MRNKGILTITSLFMVCLFVVGGLSIMAEFGDSSDPLITKSYIDSVLTQEVNSKIDSAISNYKPTIDAYVSEKLSAHETAINKKIAQIQSGTSVDSSLVDSIAKKVIDEIKAEGISQSATWTVVTLTKGQTLIGAVGTEILLRSGSGTVYSTGNVGIINLSSGSELAPSKALSANNL